MPESQALAALDSLAAKLVPQLPEATRIAVERAARYYAIQAASVDIALLLSGLACLLLLAKVMIPGYVKAKNDGHYDADAPWLVGGIVLTVAGGGLLISALCGFAQDAPLFFDPVTGATLRLLGK